MKEYHNETMLHCLSHVTTVMQNSVIFHRMSDKHTTCPKMVAGIEWPFHKGLIRSKLLHKVQVQALKDLSLLSGTL